MIIDNLTSTRVFLEKKIPITISINANVNNDGVLRVDDLGNELITKIDSGDTMLGRIDKYTGSNKVLFYNRRTRKLRLVSAGESINMPIDFVSGTKFYLGARRIVGERVSDNRFSLELMGDNIFKIFLDTGREIKSYSVDGNTIVVSGIDRYHLDSLSELVVYTYKTTNAVDEEVVISYQGFDTIFNINTFINNEYFDNFSGIEAVCFDNLAITQNTTKDTRRANFENSTRSIINTIENTVSIDTFDGNDTFDIIQYIGSDEFRMCLINSEFGRIVLVNDCRVVDGVNLSFEKEKNTKNITIDCGNYIDIKLSLQALYGRGLYGKGQYGDGTWITNSSRRDV